MTTLNDIVTVSITTASAQVKQAGFGTMLILDSHTVFPERIRFYTDLAGMVSDGFAVTSAAYKAASAAFSQNPQVQRIAIGRRVGASAQVTEISPIAFNSAVYSVKVNGLSASFTSDSSATVAEICTGLAAAISGLAISGLTIAATATEVTVTSNTNLISHSVENTSPRGYLEVSQVQTAGALAADLAAVANENNDWYALTLTTSSLNEIAAAAGYVEANKKLMIQGSQDTDILGSGTADIASVLKAASFFRSAIFYHQVPDQFIGAAMLGKGLPYNPGSLTFKFKTLAGVTASNLSATESSNALGKNANFAQTVAGVSMTGEGKVASGEYIDIVRDRDWFQARLQERIFTLLLNNPKVPFTDAGISAVEAELRAQLLEAQAAGFLADSPRPTIIVPKAKDVPSGDRAIRKLSGISFSARVAGAIHCVAITGTVTV